MMVLKRLRTQALVCINCGGPRLGAGSAIGLRLSWFLAKPIAITQAGKPRPLWLMLTVIFLTACTPNSDSEFAVYRDRLGRTLKIELSAPKPLKTPLSAVDDTAAIAIADIRLDFLDMLALDSCGLQPNKPSLGNLIAERNSSLGKVMTYSTQLQYEIKLLQALEACIADEQAPADLRETLKQTYLQKQQQLPARLLNFLQLDTTLRQQIFGSQRPLDLSSGQAVETRLALQNLIELKQHIQNKDYLKASHIDINQQIAPLYQGQLLADLQHSLRSNLTQLQLLNQQLQQWDPAWCKAETQDILQQVLLQVFIGKLQLQLAHQDGIAQQLLPQLNTLYADTPLASTVTERFHQPWQQLHIELKRHIAWWQQLRNACKR